MMTVVLCVFDSDKWYSLNPVCFWLFSRSTVSFNFNLIMNCARSLLHVCIDMSVSLNNV